MKSSLLALAVVLLVAAIALLTQLVRTERLPRWALGATSVASAGGLIGVLLSDWPSGLLSSFWVDHPVWASLVSSTLLVATLFLFYEQREAKRQHELSKGLSSAGASGVVEHLVDVEVALSLLGADAPPDRVAPRHWERWNEPGRPLRWLRNGRAAVLHSDDDPRRSAEFTVGPVSEPTPWRAALVDQSIRRLLSAMRDWSTLIGASTEGTADLLLLSAIRSELMDLHSAYLGDQATLPVAFDAPAAVLRLRTQLRVLAYSFEKWSGAATPRAEVLRTLHPLPPLGNPFDRAEAILRKPLQKSCRELGLPYA